MDIRLQNLLDALLSNLTLLNGEIERLAKTGAFTPEESTLQTIERIRTRYAEGLAQLGAIKKDMMRIL